MCCQLIGDLQSAVWEMLSPGGPVELDAVNYLVVETSGVSDPLRIIKTLARDFTVITPCDPVTL